MYVKRVFIVIALGIAGLIMSIIINKPYDTKTISSPAKVSITTTPVPVSISHTALFVPYWTLSSGIEKSYSEYIYFGITANTEGIVHNEAGYTGIPTFTKNVPATSKKILGIRLTNTAINEAILHDDGVQKRIIDESLRIAQENGFDGILLDLEYSAFPFDSVIQSVTTFSQRFADSTKNQHRLFYQAVYGDTYYRGRPYNIKLLSKHLDKLFVMAYDFHKANGDPGANFPLGGNEEEYTFSDMVHNFLADVPAAKVTVIFGMFGYDWKLNEKGKSVGQAESLSLHEITQKFLSSCYFTDCVVSTNPDSLETHIQYTDAKGESHSVWFEDTHSVDKKKDVLEKNGISSIAFWANGYF